MFKRMVRHTAVAAGLVAAVGVAAASGFVDTRKGTGEIEYLETMPVLAGDLGEVVVTAKAELGELPEVVVAAKRETASDTYLMAEVVVTAKRAYGPELASRMVAAGGIGGSALVQ